MCLKRVEKKKILRRHKNGHFFTNLRSTKFPNPKIKLNKIDTRFPLQILLKKCLEDIEKMISF